MTDAEESKATDALTKHEPKAEINTESEASITKAVEQLALEDHDHNR